MPIKPTITDNRTHSFCLNSNQNSSCIIAEANHARKAAAGQSSQVNAPPLVRSVVLPGLAGTTCTHVISCDTYLHCPMNPRI